jgi:hypothetical protein
MNNKAFDLGTIKLKVEVKDGRVILGMEALDDILNRLFPIDTTKRLDMKKKEYNKYETEQFMKRESWVRDNISEGTYSIIIRMTDKDLIREDFKFEDKK